MLDLALAYARAFLDAEIGEPSLDSRRDDRLAAGHDPDAVRRGIPGLSDDRSTRGIVVSTSVAAKTPRLH